MVICSGTGRYGYYGGVEKKDDAIAK